jgi:glucose/arabinose dehydrogenase
MRDDEYVAMAPEGARQPQTYTGCRENRQGVSVGWADVYPYTLPDQYFDVTNLPPGLYRLSFSVDPEKRFVEGRRDNNESSVLVDLNVAKRTVSVVASAAPFAAADNRFPDGMIIRAEGDSKVYVIRQNKKRHLRTEEVFLSYGYSWGAIVVLPQSVLNAIPSDLVIRPRGETTVFALNDNGYRRRIPDASILASYGWSVADAAEVNAVEFFSYPDADLIRRLGDEAVYSLRTRRAVGTLSSFTGLFSSYNPAEVHTVNQDEFNFYTVDVVAKDLAIPWDIVFLPDGDMLVTERPGTLLRIGARPATITFPSVLHVGEGGLMGLALHPNFKENNFVYVYFTTDENGKHNRVSRFRLDGNALVDEKIIFDNIPAVLYHDGGQIAFGPDGMLYMTTGDAQTPALAQDLNSLAGKTLRITAEGGIPADNPFGTAVWSYGHRNAQGIAWDDRGRMWQTEHGRSGALSGLDELNLVEKGKNYGWPTIQGSMTAPGMTAPIVHSGPDITWAPSGMAYAGGKLYFAGLRGSSLYAATLGEGATVTDLRAHLSGVYGRLRAVVLGPDGFIYITTSNRDGRGTVRPGDDKILRVYQDFLRPPQ